MANDRSYTRYELKHRSQPIGFKRNEHPPVAPHFQCGMEIQTFINFNGTPLRKSKTISSSGVSDGVGSNPLTGYSIVKAESIDAALEMLFDLC